MGTELYVQPSESRLKLEIEVANDNALKWQQACQQSRLDKHEIEKELANVKGFIQRMLDNGFLSCGNARKQAREIMEAK